MTLTLFGREYELPDRLYLVGVDKGFHDSRTEVTHKLRISTLFDSVNVEVVNHPDPEMFSVYVGSNSYNAHKKSTRKLFEGVLKVLEKEFVCTNNNSSTLAGWDSSGVVTWGFQSNTRPFFEAIPESWPTVAEYAPDIQPESLQGCVKVTSGDVVPQLLDGYMYLYRNCILLVETAGSIELKVIPAPNIERIRNAFLASVDEGAEVISVSEELRSHLLAEEI